MQYKKSDISDNYFGTVIPDPYRWLEDDNAPEVIAWVKEENKKRKLEIQTNKIKKEMEEYFREDFGQNFGEN